jgi:hypothetical protein
MKYCRFDFVITQPDSDSTMLKLITVLGGGISMVLGYQKLGYTGAGVLSCLIASVTTALLWRMRKIVDHDFV